MTIGEKVLDKLIREKAEEMRNTTIERLRNMLDMVNADIKRFPDGSKRKRYDDVSTRLENVIRATEDQFLNMECEDEIL